MNRAILSPIVCLILCACGRIDEPKFEDGGMLPIADSCHTYHGPGDHDPIIRIDKDDNMLIEIFPEQAYLNLSHDIAVEALKQSRSLNNKLRRKSSVHIFLDRHSTAKSAVRAYAMIEDSGIDGYIFAVELSDDHEKNDYRQQYAISFTVPSKEIRARLKLTNP